MKINRFQVEAFVFFLLILYCLDGISMPSVMIATGIVVIGSVIFSENLKSVKYLAQQENNKVWDVLLNNIKVSEISDKKYTDLCHDALTSSAIHRAQAKNTWYMLFLMVDKYILIFPVFLFWFAAALFAFNRDLLHVIITAVGSASTRELISWSLMTIPIFIISYSVNFAIGAKFGFINKFSEAVDLGIRQHCNVAGEGAIELQSGSERATSIFMFGPRVKKNMKEAHE